MVALSGRGRLWLLLAGAFACAEGFAPGARVSLAIVPVFSEAAVGVLSGDLDQLDVRIRRVPSNAVTVDTSVVVDTAGNVDLPLTVPLLTDPEQFEILLEGVRSSDAVVLYSGIDTVRVSASSTTPPPIQIPVSYVGPCQAASGCQVTVGPQGASLTQGDSLLMTVLVDSAGTPVVGVPVSLINLDTTLIRVRSSRFVVTRTGTPGGSARVVAQIRGDEDTLRLTVQPLGGPGPATQLAYLAQPTDVGTGATIVPPVEVAVKDQFGKIVTTWATPVTLRFGKNVGGAILGGTTTRDPVNGIATFDDLTVDKPGTGYTLIAGSDTLTAPESVPFNVTLPPAVVFAGDSSGGLSSGVFRVNPDGARRFRLDTLGSQGDVHPRWSPDRRRAVFTYDTQRIGRNELFVVAQTGDTSALLVSDTSARRARWSPNGVHLAFECGDGFSTGQDVCVVPDVTGPMAGLDRRGEGTGKSFVTDFDPSKLDGPAAFSWNPLDPNTLVVVRDSATDKAEPVSRLYLVTFGGGLVQPLSAWLFDPQSLLPLRIVSTLDWSADGATIVFAAQDPLAFDAVTPTGQRLFAIKKDGSGLRQLTNRSAFDFQPVVSPDGKQVLFFREQGCSVDYWQVGIDGTGEMQVSTEGWCDFSPDVLGHDWSPDGKDIVLVGSEPFGSLSNFGIYRIPAGTTAATYDKRVLIGRGVDLGGFVRDMQPSWRP